MRSEGREKCQQEEEEEQEGEEAEKEGRRSNGSENTAFARESGKKTKTKKKELVF